MEHVCLAVQQLAAVLQCTLPLLILWSMIAVVQYQLIVKLGLYPHCRAGGLSMSSPLLRHSPSAEGPAAAASRRPAARDASGVERRRRRRRRKGTQPALTSATVCRHTFAPTRRWGVGATLDLSRSMLYMLGARDPRPYDAPS